MGQLHLHLKTDSGKIVQIQIKGVVYLPGCPYNLLPPQLLIQELNSQGYTTQRVEHDAQEYVFRFARRDTAESHT